jgi:PKD repeat protein
MKRSLLIALLGLFAFSIQAQETHYGCLAHEMSNASMDANPQYRVDYEALQQYTANWIATHGPEAQPNSQVYIIPVVFHILHDYGAENVSDAEIRQAVALMNIDYRKLNADTVDITPTFKPLAADCEIEFRLATIDPNGNCTSGIEHLWTLETYKANDASKTAPGWMVWPRDKYVNIWIAESLEKSGAAAYAYLPGTTSAAADGVLCQYTYADNIQQTLTHECGHHFNLQHPWGQSNEPEVQCGDDGVFDTPVTMGYNPGHCPANEAASMICTPGQPENWQNYMDYSYCDHMFTYGQKQRMDLALASTTASRNNLWSNTNLIATGTDQIYPVTCGPVADFKCEVKAACVNTNVQFYDQSWKGTPTSWTWQFPGGTPSVSNDSMPVVSYSTPGVYTVTLLVSNQYGADSISKSNFIRISGPAQTQLPYTNNFEDTASFPGIDGWVYNNDGGSINWALNSFASKDSGTHSIRINNYTNTVRNIESWVTPSFNLTGVTHPITLSFDVAYAQRSLTTVDEFRVYYSTDCGANWTQSYFKSGALLATNGGAFVTNSFTPTQSQWRRETVIVNAVQNMANVRFRFENKTGRGNNIYIDNINLTGSFTGIDEEDALTSAISVYPNPSDGVSNVDFNIIKGASISLEVKDMIGQTVAKVIQNKKYEPGLHHVTLPSLAPGMYMITVTVNNKQHVVRLVVS